MATYFNKYNRTQHLTALLTWERLGAWTSEKNQLEKEEVKYLKMATSFLNKASNMIISRLGQDYEKRLNSDISNNEFYVMPKSYTERKDITTVTIDDLYTIADMALVICQSGNLCHKTDFKKCELYNAMWSCDIPVANCDTEGCPYKLEMEK